MNWERERERKREHWLQLSVLPMREFWYTLKHTHQHYETKMWEVYIRQNRCSLEVCYMCLSLLLCMLVCIPNLNREREIILFARGSRHQETTLGCVGFAKKLCKSSLLWQVRWKNVANWIGVKCINGTSSSFSSSFEEGGLSRLDEGPAMVSSSSRVTECLLVCIILLFMLINA